MSATDHVKLPRQDRSRRTLERIVRAALAILEEQGPDALTVQAVVSRARSSVGSFYARFGGKEDLLAYLDRRLWEEAMERWDAAVAARAWDALEMEERLEGAVRLLVEAHDARAASLRALDGAGNGAGGAGFERFRRHVLDGLAELLLRGRQAIAHADPDVAVRIGLAAVTGLVGTLDPATGRPLPADVLVREGRTLLAAYLTGRGPSEGDEESGSEVDFFDVWG